MRTLTIISTILLILVLGTSVQAHGSAQHLSDFNGDGFDDLAVGIPGKTIDGVPFAGAVAIITGGPEGLMHNVTHQFFHRNMQNVPGEVVEGERWGSVLQTGDFNGDGFADLAVGSPSGGPNLGSVIVFFGSNQGLTTTDAHLISPIDNITTGLFNGLSIAAGDFDNDGDDDLVIGYPQVVNNSGALVVSPGSPNGFEDFPFIIHRSELPLSAVGPAQSEQFGGALAVGDFNDDGFEDLAVGAPSYNSQDLPNFNAGRVYAIFGGSDGLDINSIQSFDQDSSLMMGSAESGDAFAALLVSGDFDGNASSDLAIAVPRESHEGPDRNISQGGATATLYGFTGLSTQGNQLWHQDIPNFNGIVEEGDLFGGQLAVGNFDGNNFDDLIIGVPLEDFDGHNNAGVVHAIYGTADGLTVQQETLIHHNLAGINTHVGGISADELFGAGLGVGDYNGDGYHDLAIGLPHKNFRATSNSGAVYVLYGTQNGISDAINQIWMQEDIVGFNLVSEENDLFGLALSGGSGECSIFAVCLP